MENKNQQLQNQINNKNMQKKSRRRDGGNIFMLIFAAIFVALIARSFTGPVSAPQLLPDGTTAPAPVELTFSDILNRADEIKTMDVRGNDASGTLTDGTPYTATITYDPEMLGKIAENGATISIDTSKTWVDYLGTWVPILMGLFFIWWIFRGFRGGASGLTRSLAQQNPTKITTGKPKTTFKDVAGIDSEKQELMEQVEKIDFHQIMELYDNTKKEIEIKENKIEAIPYLDKVKLSKEQKDKFDKLGEEIIKNGKYAVVTMAGGQGTRLRTSRT